MLAGPMKSALIITSLMCEATPLVDAWGLKLSRNGALEDRFQLFHYHNLYLGISGIGKLRSAVATAALVPHLLAKHGSVVAVNIGIAGAPPSLAPVGTLALINKVRDVATNCRTYPDILLKHPALECALDTHDHPVTTPPSTPSLVDMEGAGFMQAATTLLSPSDVALLKVVSDHCDGTRCTPIRASDLLAQNIDTITSIIEGLRTELTDPAQITADEQVVIDGLVRHARFSVTQTIELVRRLRAKKAQNEPFLQILHDLLTHPIETKEKQRAVYYSLLQTLEGDALP